MPPNPRALCGIMPHQAAASELRDTPARCGVSPRHERVSQWGGGPTTKTENFCNCASWGVYPGSILSNTLLGRKTGVRPVPPLKMEEEERGIVVSRREIIIAAMLVVLVASFWVASAKGIFSPPTDQTSLWFQGFLRDRDTGRLMGNTVVTLVGDGLPPQTTTLQDGNFGISSSSEAEQMPVALVVAGYEPYVLTVVRKEPLPEVGSYSDSIPTLFLTPVPSPHHVRVGPLSPMGLSSAKVPNS